ncbi:uncharacterized protein LOC108108456 [Drosophila eugracilis]|uniref:uncharacterized protein LOC108108456 n=1 Tax=Drosophila eugracilis TaxID=29029 RepID=UPI0007E84701|nr:uncharacterized protein LOC108108456 [Drosophila eugracilis]
MENPRTITDLPFEVLDLIYNDLDCLRDKVDLAQSHNNLGKAFALHSRNEFRTLKPSTELTDESWSFLIKQCGTSIEEICFGGRGIYWNDLITQAIVPNCPNLKSLSTDFYTHDSKSIQHFLEEMKNSLTSLTLNQRDDFPFEILKVVSEMSKLKQLSIRGNFDESVCHLENLIALEKLGIEYRSNSSKLRVDLIRICASLTNLRDLYVSDVEILPYEKPFLATWARVESLNLSRCKLPPELPDCPQLKFLNIHHPILHNEGNAFLFLLESGRNLETLYEEFDPPIDADSFLIILQACPKLRSFYTRMEYIRLYSDYVSTILEILKGNGVTQDDPFELVICRRIKWKRFRKLLRCAPDAELIDLYEGTEQNVKINKLK